MELEIKVCGNKEVNNLREVINLNPEYIGFIFYDQSKRNVTSTPLIPTSTNYKPKRVGVFVNEGEQMIRSKVDEYKLDIVQLHGDETPEFTGKINDFIPVFKAFQVNNLFNFDSLNSYLSVCYKFLFDTSSKGYGGSGKKFDWELLAHYNSNKPFILSGGIDVQDVALIRNLNHPMLSGIDLNSKFEISPGLKNINKLSTFIKNIRQ